MPTGWNVLQQAYSHLQHSPFNSKFFNYPDLQVSYLERLSLQSFIPSPFLYRFNEGPRKLTTVVDPESILKLPTGDHYELVGTVDHSGESDKSGHYTSHVKKHGKWMRCNDSSVIEVLPNSVIHGQNSLLIFEKITVNPLNTHVS